MRRVRPRRRDPGENPDRWRDVLRSARIPERYWDATIEQIKSPAVRRWAEITTENAPGWLGEGLGFYLMGELNVGKSSLAAILAKEALLRCERVLWLSVRDVPRARFREGADGSDLDDAMKGCDLLVLDDLGAERFRLGSAAGAALEETARIVYDRRRSLIVTSNLSWRQLGEHYAAEAEPFVSVMRRLVEPVHVDGDAWPMTDMPGAR